MDEPEIVTPLYVEDWFCAIHENGYLNCEIAPVRSIMPHVSKLIARREAQAQKEGNRNYALSKSKRLFEELSSAIYWEKGSYRFWIHRSDDAIENHFKDGIFTIDRDGLQSSASMYFSMDWIRCDYLDWLFVDAFCFDELSSFYNSITKNNIELFGYGFFLKILLRKEIKQKKIDDYIFKQKQLSLFYEMRSSYWELGSDLISVNRVKDALKRTEALGAIWPNPIWPILDRCENHSIHAWSLSVV